MSITTVTAPADLCLPTIGDFADTVRTAWTPGSALCFDLSQVRAPDLSVVQLVLAARRTAAEAGVALTLATPADEGLRALLLRAGLLTHPSAEDARFWLHGETVQ